MRSADARTDPCGGVSPVGFGSNLFLTPQDVMLSGMTEQAARILDPAHTVLASNGGSLLMRIRRLVGARGESANWSSQFAAGVGLLTVLGALFLVPSLSLFAEHLQQPPAPPQMQNPPGAPQPDHGVRGGGHAGAA